MNPSDFGADIFDPNDDQPSSKAPAPDQAQDAPEGEADTSAPQGSDTGADDAKPGRKKTRKKATSRRRKEETEAELATPTEATEEAQEPATDDAALESTGADATAEVSDEPEAPAPRDDEEGGERRSRRRRRRRGGEARRADHADEGAADEAAADDDATDAATEAPYGADEADSDSESADSAGAEDTEAEDTEDQEESGDFRGERDDADDERGGRRRRRRRRRGGRGEDAPQESSDDGDDEVRAGTEPRRPLRRSDRMIPVPTPGGERHGQRVAVLVDVAALLEQARSHGGELAFGKLVQHLARRRHLIRAIAYGSPELLVEIGSALRGSDLDVHGIAAPSDLPVALAVDAMSLAARVDCVVLAPAVDNLAPLAAALRAHGVRIETASFTEAHGMADDLATARHALGAESLFVP